MLVPAIARKSSINGATRPQFPPDRGDRSVRAPQVGGIFRKPGNRPSPLAKSETVIVNGPIFAVDPVTLYSNTQTEKRIPLLALY